jgi:hypothetical protein
MGLGGCINNSYIPGGMLVFPIYRENKHAFIILH